MAAGAAVEQLIGEYAGQPVVFLEYNERLPQVGDRVNYFWAAHGGGSVYYPMISVDSGYLIHSGPTDYKAKFKQMVDTELARPPQAEVQAFYQRVGDRLKVNVTVKNLSGVTLSPSNLARVHVMVYEENKIYLTSRFARAEADKPIEPALENGAVGKFILETENISGVDWSKLRAVAVVDYRPSGSTAYDMLQAAVATEAPKAFFTLGARMLNVLVDDQNPAVPPLVIATAGTDEVTWTVTENIPWLTAAAASGPAGTPITFTADPAAMVPGAQAGTIQISASGGGVSYHQELPVTGYYGAVLYARLPLALR